MFHDSEDYTGTKHPKILLAESRQVDWDVLIYQMEEILHACELRDENKVISSLKAIIPEYVENKSLLVDETSKIQKSKFVH